jgi:hypothetical protein
MYRLFCVLIFTGDFGGKGVGLGLGAEVADAVEGVTVMVGVGGCVWDDAG